MNIFLFLFFIFYFFCNVRLHTHMGFLHLEVTFLLLFESLVRLALVHPAFCHMAILATNLASKLQGVQDTKIGGNTPPFLIFLPYLKPLHY